MKLTDDMLTRAGFPHELRRFIEDNTLEFYHASDDGTLHFQIPKKDETRVCVFLDFHPADPETWAVEGIRFSVREERYHDRDCTSVAGASYNDSVNTDDDPNDIDLLIDYLESND